MYINKKIRGVVLRTVGKFKKRSQKIIRFFWKVRNL